MPPFAGKLESHSYPALAIDKHASIRHDRDQTWHFSYPMTSIPRAFFLMLALVLALLALSELGTRRLADPDEGRYSEISREMAQSNDFVTPRLNGLKYF